MTAPHIVDPAGLLGGALAETSPDLMRSLLQSITNALLSAHASPSCERAATSPRGCSSAASARSRR
jgi:hypothetical protein